MQIAFFLSLILAIAAAVFAVQNTTVVEMRFVNLHFAGSLALLLLLAFFAGFLCNALLSVPGRFKRRRQIGELKRRVADLEKRGAFAEPPATGARPF